MFGLKKEFLHRFLARRSLDLRCSERPHPKCLANSLKPVPCDMPLVAFEGMSLNQKFFSMFCRPELLRSFSTLYHEGV